MTKKQFKKLALGGTFDIIHKGHEELFSKAFELGEEIIVGITSDEFVQEMYKDHSINEYESRKNQLLEFIKQIASEDRCIVVPLDDPYGPTIHDKSIEAIIVSKESEKTADIINKIRIDNEFKPLEIISIELILSEDGQPISTTRIKKGIINKNGKLISKISTD
jgi:pantetheine-phosphate adenylyltransferase